MKRRHRAVHHVAWLLLLPALALLLIAVIPTAEVADRGSNESLPGDVAAGELP
ncbi:MAG: hypothetical protein AAGH76_01130 [Pseudomonadota bacterium]